MLKLILFLFPLLTLISSVFAVCAFEPTVAVFALALSYFFGVWLLAFFEAEFLTFAILLVYLGAIIVLFLFVVMSVPPQKFGTYAPAADLIAICIVAANTIPLLYIVNTTNLITTTMSTTNQFDATTNVELIARSLTVEFYDLLIVSSLFLLVGIIGAIFLARSRGKVNKIKNQP